MNEALKIHHDLANVILKPSMKVNSARLTKMVRAALDQYLDEDRVSVKTLHSETRQQWGDAYRTPGYYLRLYRLRAGLTQTALERQSGIRQHHLSEMEHNKRALGKANARKLAGILKCDYRKFL